MRYFTITTSVDVAEAVKKTFASEEKMGQKRTCVLGDIRIEKGMVSNYAVIQIKPREQDGFIEPSDIFFIGHFSAANMNNP